MLPGRRGELSVRDKQRVLAAVVERITINGESGAAASSATDPRTASSSPGGESRTPQRRHACGSVRSLGVRNRPGFVGGW